jgi:hypothetical protein
MMRIQRTPVSFQQNHAFGLKARLCSQRREHNARLILAVERFPDLPIRAFMPRVKDQRVMVGVGATV